MTPEEQEKLDSLERELEQVRRDRERLEEENAKLRELSRGSGPRPKARKPDIRVID
jgi:FtsZ-binding cell division protein ZapB